MSERVDRLLEQLDTAERIRLLAGHDYWHTFAIERVGLPPLHLSDGPVGVRGERTVGTVSVSFPAGVAIGATFDPEAARLLAGALADECIDKGVHVLLGPTINLQRHPLGGRHFECYSEDPFLTADLAVAYVGELQSRGIAATLKHFVANDTEFQRHTISSDLDAQTLAGLYLVPFEETVKRAAPWAVMSSYNKVNGTYAAENRELLETVLRQAWGFDGLVMSDWFGAQSTAPSALAGLDLEMPGPAIHYGERLEAAVAAGEVGEEVIAERARKVLQLVERTGALDETTKKHSSTTIGQRREISRRLAAQSFVLLQNREVDSKGHRTPLLPFDLRPGDVLAVIGPNAARTAGQGGGSARVFEERTVSVREGLEDLYSPAGVEVVHEIGCTTWSDVPDLDVPVHIEYMATTGGPVLHEEDTPRPPLLWLGDPVPEVPELLAGAFAVRCTTVVTPDESGPYQLSLAQIGAATLRLDGQVVLEGSSEKGKRFFGFGSADAHVTVELEAARSHELVAEYEVTPGSPLAGLFIGMAPMLAGDDELIARAVALARRADAVVCVVGTTAEWETEGRDRTSMDLPGRQDDLVQAVLGANGRTAVLVNAGSPVTMDWAGEAAAVMQIWFGGEQVGRAVADVLSGADEPGGRLPHTIPVRLEDTPAFPYYPGTEGRAPYGEGLLMGHRHYATLEVEPRYWFGHGLGYTTFSLSDLSTDHGLGGLRVVCTVANDGNRLGGAVVQAYLALADPPETRAALAHIGSARQAVGPGKASEVTIEVPADRLACLGEGSYEVMVGFSADPAALSRAGEITV